MEDAIREHFTVARFIAALRAADALDSEDGLTLTIKPGKHYIDYPAVWFGNEGDRPIPFFADDYRGLRFLGGNWKIVCRMPTAEEEAWIKAEAQRRKQITVP